MLFRSPESTAAPWLAARDSDVDCGGRAVAEADSAVGDATHVGDANAKKVTVSVLY